MRIRWASVLISLLIVAGGWLGSQMLIRVDQELRVIYAEYTLAATDLGHVNGELIRYRTSVIRASETDSKEEFRRIVASLPQKRARLNESIERFIEATNEASFGNRLDARQLTELRAVQEGIEAYMASSRHALQLMEQRWIVTPDSEARRLQNEAKQYLAEDAGTKYMSVTMELDRLLEVVGDIAGDVKKEADFTLRIMTIALIALSTTLCVVVLAVG
jgi:hypothetical protein